MDATLHEKLRELVEDKVVLVTGGTGTIGSEIVRQLIPCRPRLLRILSRDEYKQSVLRYQLRDHKFLRFLLGDVRDLDRLERAFEGVHIVFHAAALKRIESTEYDPIEAVKTNVLGTQNIISATLQNPSTERVVSISTDKAVNVTTTMGATKLLAERLVTWASFYRREPHKTMCSVRFGNVLDSRGSVIPIWREQIRHGGPLTLTHKDMRRFFMSIPSAVRLVLKAAVMAEGGEVFILKMQCVNIYDLAEIMVEEFAPQAGHSAKEIQINVTGPAPGEKFDEDLIAANEWDRTYQVDDELALIAPEHRKDEIKLTKLTSREGFITRPDNTLSKDELRVYLKEEGII
ncbi:MAG: polysaccharide biosynthesis protein [Candidatus Hinthialibacter antarcticus]|nr:polysaccharide biosynthesis protein [Candidatus Hinthialibacter antarcticus]